jgi:hypothetical protein
MGAEAVVFRRCFTQGDEVRALLASRFERRSISADLPRWCESSSKHRPSEVLHA